MAKGTQLTHLHGGPMEVVVPLHIYTQLVQVCEAWQKLAEESMGFRLALTNLPHNIGVKMLELTQTAIDDAEESEIANA